jgi:hypothetical protein
LDKEHHVGDQGHDEDLIEEGIPLHKNKGIINCTPLQVFDLCDAPFDDLGSEEFSEKTLQFGKFFI